MSVRTRWRRLSRPTRWGGAGVGGLLLVALALPTVLVPCVTWAVNWQLGRLPGVHASVHRLIVNPLMGYVQVRGLKVDLPERQGPAGADPNGLASYPLLRVEGLRTAWHATDLLRGTLTGSAYIDRPEATIYNFGDARGHKQKAKEQAPSIDELLDGQSASQALLRWRRPFFQFIPLRLHKARVRQGRVRYVDLTCRPTFAYAAEDISVDIDNITNRQQLKDTLYARAEAQTKLGGDAPAHLRIRFDPLAHQPRFTIDFELGRVGLSRFNPLLQAHAHMRLASGSLSLFAQADARGGHFKGYVKPLLQNLRLQVDEDAGRGANGDKDALGHNVIGRTLGRAVNAVTHVFENKKDDQLATKLAVEGDFDGPDPNLWDAVFTFLRNAFTTAVQPGLDFGKGAR